MPRRLRKDYTDAWHHVISRGIAKRTLFETGPDVRFFLSCLARRVHAGDMEIHSYSILTTHFHLLVRSPRGRLSAAMQRALDSYARWFNRSRRRDGPLFRSRFVNRLVETESYWMAVLRYIDLNPVAAGLAPRATDHPYGSAFHFARPGGPPWLSRAVVEDVVRGREDAPWDPTDYLRFSSEESAPGAGWVVERRLRDQGPGEVDPLDDLLDKAPGKVRDWMERKALLADGTAAGWPLVSPGAIRACLPDHGPPEGILALGRRRAPRVEVLEAGLLRLCAGLRQEEIALRMGLHLSRAQQRVRMFLPCLARDEAFLADATLVLERALRSDHGCGHGRRPTALRALLPVRALKVPWPVHLGIPGQASSAVQVG